MVLIDRISFLLEICKGGIIDVRRSYIRFKILLTLASLRSLDILIL